MKYKKLIYWMPRVLGILFALFLSIFALDVFSEYGFPMVLVALFMHLLPTLLLVGLLVFAWKKPFYGGIGFLVLAVGFALFFNREMELIGYLILSLPLLVIGVLFIVGAKVKFK